MTRRAPRVPFLFLVATACAACSSPASSPNAPVETNDPGGDAGTEDTAPPCTSGVGDELFSYEAPFFSDTALELTEQWAAVGHLDTSDKPIVSYASRADGAVAHVAASKYPVIAKKYGARPLDMIFAHGRFGITFGSERADGWQAAVFASVDPATGTATPDYYASNEIDRTGSGGKGSNVSARHPMVVPLASGFLVAWEDFRTKEPVVTGVNLFGWSGIYAKAFDANGKPTASQDVQVAQPTGLSQSGQSLAGAPTSKGQLVVWLGRKDSRTVLFSRVGPSSAAFTTWTPGAPLADFAGQEVQTLALAQGKDGKHLAALAAGPLFEPDTAIVRILSENGEPIGGSRQLHPTPGHTISGLSVISVGDGYVVAFGEMAKPVYPADPTLASVHVATLDAAGEIVSEKSEPVALENVSLEGTPRVSVTEAGTQALISTRAPRADKHKSELYKTKTVGARLVTVCR